MIRPLGEADRPAAVAFLRQAPAFNLYALGNLQALGFDSDVCQFWGDFDEAGTLRAVLNRYMSGWVLYGLSSTDWPGLATVVDTHPIQADRLQDNPGGVESFLPYLRRYRSLSVKAETLMNLAAADFQAQPMPGDAIVRRATQADFDALVVLYADAGDMRRDPGGVRHPLLYRRIWLADLNGDIVSAALTNAETTDQAMIGGVFTRPDARGRGLSQAVMSALCADLLAEGRQPVLYWINPIAGGIYRKLGFRAVGEWRAVRLERTSFEPTTADR